MIKKTILGSLFMTCALTAGAQGIYQFADPGFEQNWTNKKEPGNGWHSFATAGGGLASFASMSPSPEHVAEGYQSAHSVKLTSKFAGIPGIMGANANGNLTTGRINMGSMTPSEKTNFNHTDLTGDAEEKLEPQYLEFAGTPDAVTFYAKFTAGTGNSAKQARGKFILHDEYSYGDPEEYFPEQESHRVALAMQLINESPDWKQYTVPFTYDQDVKPAKQYLLASFTTNPEPGESAGDVLYIDDIYFVYNSELASLTYDGTPVSEIANTIDLSEQVYDATKLSYTLTGKGATAERSYNAQTGVLTLTVKGNDWSVNPENQHVYTIRFKPYTGNLSDVMVSDTRLINVTMGQPFPSLNTVSLTNQDGAVSFTMENFSFSGLHIGDVTLNNVALSQNADGSTHVTAYNGALALMDGAIVAKVTVTGDVTAEGGLTANVQITWNNIPITAEVSPVPFAVSVAGRTLAVTGELSSNLAQLVMVDGSANISAIDLTGATLTGAFSTEDFGAAANCLFLVPEGAEFTGNNVVKGAVCDNFVLTDGQSFNAPTGFTANQITYKRATAASTDEKDEVYTFVLPFTFTADKVNGTVYELTGVNDGVLDFTSIEGELKANRPYLVVSKGTELLNNEGLSGEVLATDNLTNEVIGGVAMVGAYEATPITSDASWYGYNAKGEFVKATSGTINPFRAAIKSTGIAPSSYALKLDGTVTGILNLENPNAKVDVYTISGVCVRKNVPAASALNGLSRGVYIVGGQKVVK